jgi:ectoine hydroxylase-related dioxygenase (phytanoyl-CoA dioxygenase family)
MKNDYEKNGYILLKNVFDKSILLNIKNQAQVVFKKQFERLSINNNDYQKDMIELFEKDFVAFTNCGKHIQHGLIDLYKLCTDDSIIKIVKELGLEYPSIATRPVLFYNHPHLAKDKHYYKTPPHQDWPSMKGSKDSIVAWIPLVESKKEIGTLRVVPESHKNGIVSDHVIGGFACVSETRKNDFIDIEMNIGDILLFSSFLVHESGDIINDKIRWSCSFRYNNMFDSEFINRKYEFSYIYKPTTEIT